MPNKNNQNFWDQLKSRNVIRVAIAYSLTGWLIMQIASIVLPAFEAPNWVLKVVIFLLVLGLPIALILSWFFEMTSDGLKKSKNVTLEESTKGGRKVRNIIYIVLSLSILYLLFDKFYIENSSVEVYIPEKSIAVLPFKNLSSNNENEYFSDGVMEAILSNLSRLKDVKVVSRTSVERYRTSDLRIPQIGKELETSYILTGSVQRNDDEIRITVQLISAKTDKQLWSEKYDRKLDDVFEIQTEIANAISDNLELLITSKEKELLANAPTTNIKAYDLFLQAKSLSSSTDNYHNILINLSEKAIALDPEFSYPYIQLAHGLMQKGYHELLPDKIWIDSVLTLIDKAIELKPDSPEGYEFKVYYYNRISRPIKNTVTINKILELLPNNPHYQSLSGEIKIRNGKIKEGVELKLKALTSIPTIEVRNSIRDIKNYLNLLDPNFRYDFAKKIHEKGWFSKEYTDGWFSLRNRDYEAYLNHYLSQTRYQNLNGPNEKVILANVYNITGHYEEAIKLYEERISESVGSNMGSLKYGFKHRYGYALLKTGEKNKGVALLNSYSDTLKISIEKNGLLSGSEYYDLAIVNGVLGNKKEALEWLELEMSNNINSHNLRVNYLIGDNMIDPLREEPEYKAIVKKTLDKEAQVSKVFHEKLKVYQARGELLWLTLD